MQRKFILMIYLTLGLLSNSGCTNEGGCGPSPSHTMYINTSQYNLSFKYGYNKENYLLLEKNDTVKISDYKSPNTLIYWFASGNPNEMTFGDSSIVVFEYSIYDDNTTIYNGEYYRTCKFTDSLINDIKLKMAEKNIKPQKVR
ncbi:MAG: hypothetical protein IKQ70_13390 [Bacteroidales bacterium]|nr:hypothetical protein [Bacteroidales bacterium]